MASEVEMVKIGRRWMARDEAELWGYIRKRKPPKPPREPILSPGWFERLFVVVICVLSYHYCAAFVRYLIRSFIG